MRIEIVPIGKPRMTRADRWKGRECVERYWVYKDELRLRLPNYTLPQCLAIEFQLAMPESWSERKKQKFDGQPHQQKPDLDNLLKAWMDCFADSDAYVSEIHARKTWARTGAIILPDD